MRIIRKEPNPSGAYPPMQEDMSAVLDGFALWPESLDTAAFYKYNGFVALTVEPVEGVDTVTGYQPNIEAWEAWKASSPPETDPPPSAQEQMRADIDFLAALQGVSL